jgi:hypothetical protein
MSETSNDPLATLEAFIVNVALKRDQKSKKLHDEQSARENHREQAQAIWRQRKAALTTVVQVIDSMLKRHGYLGLVIGEVEAKHSDIDRVLLKFAHGVRDHSKILLCLKASGEFTCAIEAAHDPAAEISIPIEQLSEDRLKSTIAEAVQQCLARDAVEVVMFPKTDRVTQCDGLVGKGQ